jgi:hypothetical protein
MAFDGYSRADGYNRNVHIEKGGVNAQMSRVRERPADPPPIRQAGTQATTVPRVAPAPRRG